MWNTRLKAFGNFLTAACMVMPCWWHATKCRPLQGKLKLNMQFEVACIVSKISKVLAKEFRLVACVLHKQSSWVILSRNNCHGPIDSRKSPQWNSKYHSNFSGSSHLQWEKQCTHMSSAKDNMHWTCRNTAMNGPNAKLAKVKNKSCWHWSFLRVSTLIFWRLLALPGCHHWKTKLMGYNFENCP